MTRWIVTLITACSLILSAMDPVPYMRYEYNGWSGKAGVEAVPEETADIKAEKAQEEPAKSKEGSVSDDSAKSKEGSVSDDSAKSKDGSVSNDSTESKEGSVSDNSVRQEDDGDSEEAVSDNGIVTTKHTIVISGNEIAYTVKAGMMELESDGAKCEMFYTSYTVDDEEDRPVTFAFNGGPGASSIYLHMGCLGPRIAKLNNKGEAASLPPEIIDNENSLLDTTDLVFIDPVGTGYSHAVNEEDEGHFIGYQNDIRTVGDFIRKYTDQNNRWGDETYIAGESYGTVRAVGVCKYLVDTYAMYVNGLMLISSVNDYSAVTSEKGNDAPYALSLPTYAADAWYQGMLSEDYQSMELEDYLDEVKSFAEDEYIIALFKGSRLTESERSALAEKISGYTGLSKDFILENNLRVGIEEFCRGLLKDKGRTVGRIDGRITGPSVSGSISDGTADPSGAASDMAYANAFLEYATEELKYKTDREFIPSSLDVNSAWDYYTGDFMGYLSQEDTIYECMSKNKYLKIWVIGGYYDGATPFYSVQWTFDHVFLSDDREADLSFSFYPSGHMFYLDKEALGRFKDEAGKWYK